MQMSQETFLFFLVHNHKKDPYSVNVSHGVKFSTSTMIDLTAVLNTTLVLVGRRVGSISIRIQCQIIFVQNLL